MSIFDAVGGEPVIAKAVEQFYGRVVADPLLKLYFKRTDVASLQRRFQKYLAYALSDNEASYDGTTMYEAHAGRGITDEAVDSFLQYLRESLTESGVPAAGIEKIMNKVSPVKDVVVDKFIFPGTYVYKPDSARK